MGQRSVITGTGHYLPERVVENDELAPRLETDSAWIESRTGIQRRHVAAAEEASSDMGLHAARAALEDAGCEASELDALIFATLSADHFFPGSGVFLQRKLGLVGTPALDVRNQCSGFLYGLSVADAWLRAGVYDRVLLVGAEVHSVGLDYSKAGRNVTALFGDGGGAVVLERETTESSSTDEDSSSASADRPSLNHRGVIDVRLGADGSGAENLWCELPGSGAAINITHESMRQGRHIPQMNGRAVFRRAVEVLERSIRELLDDFGLRADEIILVPHQANRRINEYVAQKLDLPEERVIHTIEDHGNTTAASIPMALDIARADGRIQDGDLVLMAAFGSGFTWGTALLRM